MDPFVTVWSVLIHGTTRMSTTNSKSIVFFSAQNEIFSIGVLRRNHKCRKSFWHLSFSAQLYHWFPRRAPYPMLKISFWALKKTIDLEFVLGSLGVDGGRGEAIGAPPLSTTKSEISLLESCALSMKKSLIGNKELLILSTRKKMVKWYNFSILKT
jgi:hypothetical protein